MTNDDTTCPMCDQQYSQPEPEIDIQFQNAPETREEAFFDGDEEDTLFDAWQMLRYYGVPKDKLWPVTMAIELSTIYDRENLESYYERFVADSE